MLQDSSSDTKVMQQSFGSHINLPIPNINFYFMTWIYYPFWVPATTHCDINKESNHAPGIQVVLLPVHTCHTVPPVGWSWYYTHVKDKLKHRMTRVKPTIKTVLSHAPVLTVIFQPLNPNVAADSWNYLHFKCPSLHLSVTAFFPFTHIKRYI